MSRISNPTKSQSTTPPPETKGPDATGRSAESAKAAGEEAPALDELCAEEEVPGFTPVDYGGQHASLDEVLPKVKELTSRGVLDWAVTGDEARAAIDELGKLSPEERKQALAKLEADGTLEKLVDAASDKDKMRLCDLAVSAGLVDKRTKPKPEGTFDPPAPLAFPATYLAPKGQKLSKGLQDLVDKGNAAAKKRYELEYGAYKQRYIAGIENAKSAAEIRRFGRPVDEHDVDILQARYDKISLLRGETPAGELSSYAKVTTKHQGAEATHDIEVGRTGVKYTTEAKAKLEAKTDGGTLATDAEGNLKLSVSEEVGGKKHSVSVTTKDGDVSGLEVAAGDAKLSYEDGKASAELKVKGAKVALKTDGDKLTELSAEVKDIGGTVKSDGEKITEVSVKAKVVEAKASKDSFELKTEAVKLGNDDANFSFGGVSRVNTATGKVEGAFYGKAKIGDTEVEGEFGARANLGSREGFEHSIIGDLDFYDTPPELEKGVPWDKVPEKVRALYEKAFGWTKEEWEGIRNRPRPEDIPRQTYR